MRNVILYVALAACSGTKDDAVGGDGGGDNDGDSTEPPPVNSGFVSVTNFDIVAGSASVKAGSASASFVITRPGTTSTSCTQHELGACTAYVCPTTGTPMYEYRSAG